MCKPVDHCGIFSVAEIVYAFFAFRFCFTSATCLTETWVQLKSRATHTKQTMGIVSNRNIFEGCQFRFFPRFSLVYVALRPRRLPNQLQNREEIRHVRARATAIFGLCWNPARVGTAQPGRRGRANPALPYRGRNVKNALSSRLESQPVQCFQSFAFISNRFDSRLEISFRQLGFMWFRPIQAPPMADACAGLHVALLNLR